MFVRSPIATLTERLYIKDGKTMSVQDSIISMQEMNSEIFAKKNTHFAPHRISEISTDSARIFHDVTRPVQDDTVIYLVNDKVPGMKWVINQSKTKKILGYKCYSAEGIYRGNPVTAFFTPEIKLDAGPYKFFGLPGLILEVFDTDSPSNRWRAKSIDLNNTEKITYAPLYKYYNMIPIRDFINIEDEARRAFSKKLSEIKISGSTSVSLPGRLTLEKRYEWETKDYE